MGSTSKDFTVSIVGGGIGGLVLALSLLHRNVPVLVFEAAPAFTEIGLGLSIGPAAHRAMALIEPRIREIYDSLVTTHADSPGYEEFRQTWFEIIWACGAQEGDLLMNLKALPSGQTTVRRADFLDALVKLIPPEVVRFGKRLESLCESTEGIHLTFADGTTYLADVVVGCDGIKSKVRELILPDELRHKKPECDHRARVSTMYVGEGAYGISYPIMRAQKVNFGLYVLNDEWDHDTWVRQAKLEDIKRDASNMGRYVNAIVEHIQDPSQWAIFEHPHVSTYVRSKVAILGDAAHASTPHQGAGAGQAIEDAHVLAELLGDDRVNLPSDVVKAFRAYDDIRRPRSQQVVATSKEAAYLLCLCLDGVGRDEEKLKKTFNQRLRWLWDIDIQGQADQAREKMIEYMQI